MPALPRVRRQRDISYTRPRSASALAPTTNEVASHFRRRRRHGVSLVPATDELRREVENGETAVSRHELFVQVNHALRTLGADEQALIVLRYFEHKPFAEIAEILGKRSGTLAMRTHRALSKLRSELERRGIDHEGLREILERPAHAGC